mgnify:FL=1
MGRHLALLAAFVLTALPAGAALVEVGTDDVGVLFSGDPLIDFQSPVLVENPDDDHLVYLWHEDDGTGRTALRGAVTTFEATASVVAFPFAIDAGVGQTRRVAAVYDDRAERFLVVWEEDGIGGVDGAFEIWGRLLGRDYAPIGDPFRISTMGTSDTDVAFDAGAPDVAVNTTDNEFVVVWHGDDDGVGKTDGAFEVFARRITSDGTLLGTGRDPISDLAGTTVSTEPAIAFDDFHREYLVAHSGHASTGAFTPTIRVNRLGVDGLPVDGGTFTDFGVGAGAGDLERNPDLAYDARGNRFLLVWDAVAPAPGGEVRVQARPIDLAQDPLALPVQRVSTAPSGGDRLRVARDPAVAYGFGADGFVVTWSGSPSLVDTGELEIVASMSPARPSTVTVASDTSSVPVRGVLV